MINMRVIGVGGAGKNTIQRMKEDHLVWDEVEYLTIDLDAESVETRASGADISVVVTGLGGTCSGTLAPEVIRKERQAGSLVITAAYFPFSFEGHKHKNAAQLALEKIQDLSDAVFLIHNDDLFRATGREDGIKKCFARADVQIVQIMECLLHVDDSSACKTISPDELLTALRGQKIFCIAYGVGSLKDAIKDIALKLVCSRSAADLVAIDSAILSIRCGFSADLAEAEGAAAFIKDLLPSDARVLVNITLDPMDEETEILGIFCGKEYTHVS